MNLSEVRFKYARKCGERDHIDLLIENTKKEIRNIEEGLDIHKKAQSIIKQVARKTQQQLEFHVSTLVSTCLRSVLADPYEMQLRFEERRGVTEADLIFTRDGEEFDLEEDCGGGVLDIAAFALRVVAWKLSSRKLRPVLILDEPFKFLDEDRQPTAAKMVRDISQKLGLQIIMASHETGIIGSVDKSFSVSMRGGISCVREDE